MEGMSGLGNCLALGAPTQQTCIQGERRLVLEAVTKTKEKNPVVCERVDVDEC